METDAGRGSRVLRELGRRRFRKKRPRISVQEMVRPVHFVDQIPLERLGSRSIIHDEVGRVACMDDGFVPHAD
jgi:hypothetical protein